MNDLGDRIWSEFRKIRAEFRDQTPVLRWATVTSVDPLRVTPDGDTSSLAEAPDTLVGGLMVGDRVRLVIVARRALILGRSGGAPADVITVDGITYPASGTLPITVPSWAVSVPPVYGATVNVPAPFTPPEGWGFQVFTAQTTGFTIASNSNRMLVNGAISVRVVQFMNSQTSALTRIGWRLTRT